MLYAVVLLTLTALTAENLVTPEGAHTILDGALAVAALAGITLWIRGNRVALDQQDWCECAADTMRVRVISSRRPELSRTVVPLAPDSVFVDTPEETWAVGVADR